MIRIKLAVKQSRGHYRYKTVLSVLSFFSIHSFGHFCLLIRSCGFLFIWSSGILLQLTVNCKHHLKFRLIVHKRKIWILGFLVNFVFYIFFSSLKIKFIFQKCFVNVENVKTLSEEGNWLQVCFLTKNVSKYLLCYLMHSKNINVFCCSGLINQRLQR